MIKKMNRTFEGIRKRNSLKKQKRVLVSNVLQKRRELFIICRGNIQKPLQYIEQSRENN